MGGFMMVFGGINYLAIFIAAIAAFMFGGVYYGALVSKPWMKAARIDDAASKMTAGLIIISLLCELIMAVGLAGVLGHLGTGQVTMMNGIISGFFLWLMLIMPSMVMNHRYQKFGWDLSFIDGAHWLGVVVIMGGIIGWMGV
jgi:Protein of unknown function (DUF1761)